MDTSPQPQAPHEIATHQQYHYRPDVHTPSQYNQMQPQYAQQPHNNNFANQAYAPAPTVLPQQPAPPTPQTLNAPPQPQQPAVLPPAAVAQPATPVQQIPTGASNGLQLPVPNPMRIGANGVALSGNANANIAPPDITLISKVEGGRKYELHVMQQPIRARMCGFGDKDRRPITPPPCIRLLITDPNTGREIDLNDVDHSMFVLNVDLWSADGQQEVNLVRHSATSPSISGSNPVSYAEIQRAHTAFTDPFQGQPNGYRPNEGRDSYSNGPGYPSQTSYSQSPSQGYPQAGSQYGQQYNAPQSHFAQQGYPQSQQHNPGYAQHQGYPGEHNSPMYGGHNGQNPYPNEYDQRVARPSSMSGNGNYPSDPNFRVPQPTSAPSGMFTRNLIGSLSASSFRLSDTNDKVGIWFVMQDLSVRTEGNFRLRLSFVNVGAPGMTANGNPSNENSIVNTGRAPVLASCFSDVFTVYSAKKFPGVVESTPLSKCFATQGIKIPIRKDAPNRREGREEYDADDA